MRAFRAAYLSAVIFSGNNQMAKFIGRKAILQTALIFDIYQKKKSSPITQTDQASPMRVALPVPSPSGFF
jgi:hypothetical protein